MSSQLGKYSAEASVLGVAHRCFMLAWCRQRIFRSLRRRTKNQKQRNAQVRHCDVRRSMIRRQLECVRTGTEKRERTVKYG
jgi:hypothetical protein